MFAFPVDLCSAAGRHDRFVPVEVLNPVSLVLCCSSLQMIETLFEKFGETFLNFFSEFSGENFLSSNKPGIWVHVR